VITSKARIAAASAIGIGIAGDLLLRGAWYLGFVGLVFLMLGVAWAVTSGAPGSVSRALVLGLTALAATGLILRDEPMLYFFNFVAVLTGLALLAWLPLGRSFARFRVRDALRAWSAAVFASIANGPSTLVREPHWPRPVSTGDRRVRSLAVGTLLAVPPVFVVGALLAEADPAFGSFLTAWPDLGLENAVGHILMAGAIAWPTAGWLRGTVEPALATRTTRYGTPSRLDFFGLVPALYGLAAVIAAYLAFQARALFGGAAYVERTAGLTYAEYARRGFFELLTVTALVLAVLLCADHLLERRSEGAERRFRVTGWTLILLLGVLMLSALQRMWVYVSYYGFSETRLYATAGMTWVGMAMGWFGVTILRGRRSRFGIGLLVASAGWVATLNLIDPGSVVVKVNLERALAGAGFDAEYHRTLSADAIPTLVAGASRLDALSCESLVAGLHERWQYRWDADPGRDWREWTLPRSRARKLLDHPVGILTSRYCTSSSPLTS
jgi:uncharacterized protein DUF4153